MPGFPSPFSSDDGGPFDGYDEFVADDLPRPGEFLDGHGVLTGADHLAFHRLTRDCFEERGVYDMTFDYNLARLNLDARYESAGFRYAVGRRDAPDAGDSVAVENAAVDVDRVFRAEFTPTTAFCPQTHTLTIGEFRAWNGLADRHEYDPVRVRVAPMHNQSEAVNERLAELEESFLETGDVEAEPDDGAGAGAPPVGGAAESGARDDPTDAPF